MQLRHTLKLAVIPIAMSLLCSIAGNPQMLAADIYFGGMKADKILFLGNSVTYHPENLSLTPPWEGDWGMAASTAENDYAHRVTQHIADCNGGNAPEFIAANIYLYGMFEQKYPDYNVESELGTLIGWGADILVTQIGDNSVSNPDPWPSWSDPDNQDAFYASFGNLLTAFKNTSQQPEIFVLSTFWPNSTMDGILEHACMDAGGTFVNIGFAEDPAYIGGWGHPNDAGMAVIAGELLNVMAPEPGTLVLLACGIMSAAAYMWRKHRKP